MGGTNALAVASFALNQVRQHQAHEYQQKAARQQAQTRIERLRQAQAAEDRQRRERLREEQARRRARFGAAGVGARGGSAEAVLEGLEKDTDSLIAEDRRRTNTAIADINRGLAERRRQNLLEASRSRQQFVFDMMKRNLKGASLLER